jgi:hypothetical protein
LREAGSSTGTRSRIIVKGPNIRTESPTFVPSIADEAESTRISTLLPTVLPRLHSIIGSQALPRPRAAPWDETRRYLRRVDQDLRRGYPARITEKRS